MLNICRNICIFKNVSLTLQCKRRRSLHSSTGLCKVNFDSLVKFSGIKENFASNAQTTLICLRLWRSLEFLQGRVTLCFLLYCRKIVLCYLRFFIKRYKPLQKVCRAGSRETFLYVNGYATSKIELSESVAGTSTRRAAL